MGEGCFRGAARLFSLMKTGCWLKEAGQILNFPIRPASKKAKTDTKTTSNIEFHNLLNKNKNV